MALASTEWMKDAACRDLSRDELNRLFFPQKGGVTNDARKICDGCPVFDECKTYTMDWERGLPAKQRYSIAFGTGSGERVRLEKSGQGRKKPGPKPSSKAVVPLSSPKRRKLPKVHTCPFCDFGSTYRPDIATHIGQGMDRPCIDCMRPSCVAPRFAVMPASYVGPTICPDCLSVSAAC